MLNDHNRQLQRLRSTGASVTEDIAARTALLTRLANETAAVDAQRSGVLETNASLRRLAEGFRAAPVLDYVRGAAERHQLTRDVATLQRKVPIHKFM